MNPQDLVPHRIQLHYAIQFSAATGMALGSAQPDSSQMALAWDDELRSFVGQKILRTALQVALQPDSLTSLILQDRQPVASLSLVGQTLETALNWHKVELAKLGVTTEAIQLLEYPPDDFPQHPLAQGAAFEPGDPAARKAVAAYYAATRPLLEAIVAANPVASPVYIWPHHFDMATLLTYPGATEADTRYLGVGLSPGDVSYGEPYWYISLYPYPDAATLPRLPNGGWHTNGWIGAVLTASQLENDSTLQTFIETAVAVSKELLGIQ